MKVGISRLLGMVLAAASMAGIAQTCVTYAPAKCGSSNKISQS